MGNGPDHPNTTKYVHQDPISRKLESMLCSYLSIFFIPNNPSTSTLTTRFLFSVHAIIITIKLRLETDAICHPCRCLIMTLN